MNIRHRFRGKGTNRARRGYVGGRVWKWNVLTKICLGLLLLLVLGSGVIFFLINVSQKQWNGINRASVVLVSNNGKVNLVSFQPDMNLAVRVIIDPDVVIPIVEGYGEYRIGVVRKLEEQENLKNRLLVPSLEHWLGVIILGEFEKETDWENMSRFELGKEFILDEVKGMKFGDRLTMALMLWIAPGRLENVNLASSYGREEREIDGQKRIIMEKRSLEKLAEDWMIDQSILAEEGISIAVMNGTESVGIATMTADTLSRIGYDVVLVAETPRRDSTIIFVQEKLSSNKKIIYPIEKLVSNNISYAANVLERYRAEVVVLLGKDYAKRISGM